MFAARFCSRTILALLVLGVSAKTATSACADLWINSFSSQRGLEVRQTKFRPDEKFVVCFRLSEEAFVSLWDAPPRGDMSRLFPNALSHRNNSTLRAVKLSAKEHCFGTRENFPLYFPESQGTGTGKLTLIGTASVNDQPTLDDYKIPGESMTRSAMDQFERTFRMRLDCKAKFEEQIEYSISR